MKLGILLVSLSLFTSINAEYFSSFVQIQKALEYVRSSSLHTYLESFVSHQRTRLEYLRHVNGAFQALQRDNAGDIVHPLGALKYVESAARIWTWLDMCGTVFNTAQNFDKEAVLNYTTLLPDEFDVEGSAIGIIVIQEIYNLNIEDIADGLLKGHQAPGLSAQELISIAKAAPRARLWNIDPFKYETKRGLDFLKVALSRAKPSDALDLYDTFLKLIEKINCTCTKYHRKILNRILDLDPSLEISDACFDDVDGGGFLSPCTALHNIGKFKDSAQMRFEALCRGEVVRRRPDYMARKRPRLACMYVHNNDPRLVLAPEKVEQLSDFNPQITLIHDVIEERHVAFFMGEARDNLKRGVTSFTKIGRVTNFHKVSQQYLLPKEHNELELKHVRARLSALTQLRLDSFEKFLVVNYASGGIYGVHMDAFGPTTQKNFTNAMNNRMVTIIIYLNDVSDGGETVFPNMGIRVTPKKYTALMFYNMYRSCDPNDFSEHSSCPIVYGTKWIANQWIGSRGQEFTYSCMKDPAL